MEKGQRIVEVEKFYILGFWELLFGALAEQIDKEKFEENYDIVASSIKDYIFFFRGWEIKD